MGMPMRKLKAQYFLIKNKKFFRLVFMLGVVLFFVLGFTKVNEERIINNPTLFGVFGTLTGAFIGAVFSLFGSIWVNKNERRVIQNMKRKSIIYSPLYDELIENQDVILIGNPYPEIIDFKKNRQTIVTNPRFSAWGRIKSDTRYLEVPSILVKQMDKLEDSIYCYLDARKKASHEIDNLFSEILKNNNVTKFHLKIGNYICREILAQNEDAFFQEMNSLMKDYIDCFKIDKIIREFYDKGNNAKEAKDVRKKYHEWMTIQGETIEMLSLLIKHTILQYEG